jgi:hypothetical protein
MFKYTLIVTYACTTAQALCITSCAHMLQVTGATKTHQHLGTKYVCNTLCTLFTSTHCRHIQHFMNI